MRRSIVIKSQYRIAVELRPRQLQQVGQLTWGSWSRPYDEPGRVMQGQFLLDTGAYGAMIDLAVAQSLELAPQGLRQIHGIHGYGRLELYIGRRALPAHDGEGHRKDYVTDIE